MAKDTWPIEGRGTNAEIKDTTAVWANSAAANTEQNIDIVLPENLQGEALYVVLVHNPSSVTALTVVAKNKWTDSDSNARYSELTRWAVSMQDGSAKLVQGWLLADAGRLTLSNDTVLGVSDGFTAYVQVRKV